MRLRVNPWAFLARLVVLFFLTFLIWTPAAPYYKNVLLWASRAAIWVSELPWGGGTTLRTGSPCIGPTVRGSARGCGQYCDSSSDCPSGVACVSGICELLCGESTACKSSCGAASVCAKKPDTAIFYHHRDFAKLGIAPQGIPAEWVMANLVLLLPLMLATPAPSWRARLVRLAIAFAAALVLQVADVMLAVKSFYAEAFHWGSFTTRAYKFLDAFFQSWDTQLFPFAIWAGIHFRDLVGLRLAASEPAKVEKATRDAARAQRRRKKARRT
jgi:hypothetical protein